MHFLCFLFVCLLLFIFMSIKCVSGYVEQHERNEVSGKRKYSSLTEFRVGKSSTFLILSSHFDKVFLLFLQLFFSFSSSFWLSGYVIAPISRAKAHTIFKFIGFSFHFCKEQYFCHNGSRGIKKTKINSQGFPSRQQVQLQWRKATKILYKVCGTCRLYLWNYI